MAYSKQTWANEPSTTTPVSATRLSYMEDGIAAAATAADTANSGLGGKANTGHTHDDRYYTETEANARFVRTVNGTGPDASGNVTVSGGTGGATTFRPYVCPEDNYPTAGTGSDDTTALRDALNRAGPGVTVLLSPKTYRHNAVIDDALMASGAKAGYRVQGNGARLLATVPTASAIKVHGAGVSWTDTVFELQGRTGRLDPYEAQKVVVYGDNFTGINLTSKGSAATGFFLTGVDGFRLDRLRVEDTLADGIHITGGSSNGTVEHPLIINGGDDGVAVVSYVGGSDPGLCSNITVVKPVVNGSKAGRGCTVVGGDRITYQSVQTDDTFASGIYVACETYGSNPTHGFSRIKFTGQHVLRRANRNIDPNGVADPVDHGAVMVANQRSGVVSYDLLIEGVTTYDTRAVQTPGLTPNPWEVGAIATGGGVLTGLVFRAMKFVNGPATYYSNVTATGTTAAPDGVTYTNVRRYDWVRSTTATAVAS